MKASGKPASFVVVGAMAAAVHLGVVYLLVNFMQVSPPVANLFGFGVAFFFSYLGHRRYTFSANARLTRSLGRWFRVSVAAFVANQILYTTALPYFPQSWYLFLLAGITLVVAAGSYLMGKVWAFSS